MIKEAWDGVIFDVGEHWNLQLEVYTKNDTTNYTANIEIVTVDTHVDIADRAELHRRRITVLPDVVKPGLFQVRVREVPNPADEKFRHPRFWNIEWFLLELPNTTHLPNPEELHNYPARVWAECVEKIKTHRFFTLHGCK